MGLRADITPQVARIDAHLLNRPGVTRLCYAGNVLHTRPAGFHATREPIQVGAEIYGHAGLEADIEIQAMMLSALAAAGLTDVRLDLCHAGILAALLDGLPLFRAKEEALFAALETKDVPALRELTVGLPDTEREALLALPTLYGGADVLERARAVLPDSPAIRRALDELASLAVAVEDDTVGNTSVNVDLSDLRGYHYHSGVMFTAYVAGLPNHVARGGRYDKVGEAFGRARPATGFSLDLREVAALSPVEVRAFAIFAPWDADPALRGAISALRQAGEIVIQSLPGHTHELDEFNCDRQLVKQGGGWVVAPR
jgi:ATP phosphoribosyltransferase regulatory subunit